MRIGIEAQRIFRRNKHGMDIVAIQLIRNLQRVDTTNEYVVFVKDDEDDSVIRESANVKVVRIKGGPYPYWEQFLLPSAAKNHNVDLLHCTSNTSPIRFAKPLVLTLHDIIYLERWNFTRGSTYQIVGNLYRRWNVPLAVGKASQIITVSNYERKRILEHFGLPAEKITAVRNGVAAHFRKITDQVILDEVKKKYKLPDQFIFFLGNTDPKKNVAGVMKSLSLLRKRGDLKVPLVMVDIDRGFLIRLLDGIGDRELLNHISFTGYVPNDELPALYSLATVFLYPSLRESFGIPILEAMSCGTPVITSTTSSMPEVAGDAAMLVDPGQPEEIAEALAAILRNGEQRTLLSEKGLQQCKKFSWEQNARQTLQLYEKVLKG